MSARASGKLAKLARLRRTFRNWPRVLLDHLGLARGAYACKLRDGTTFDVRAGTDDRHVLFEIFVQGIYDAPIRPGDTVVDIGANIGGFTILAGRRGARVIAFEPFPANFVALERNVQRNGLHATLVQAAVADAERTSELFIPDDESYSGRYSLHRGHGGETIQVTCIPLDAVLLRYDLPHIDLLKLDCQGSEYEILFNASAETLARTRALIIECEEFPDRPEWSTNAMRRFLETHGFATSAAGNLVRATRVGASTALGDQKSGADA